MRCGVVSVVCDEPAPTAIYTLSLHDALPIYETLSVKSDYFYVTIEARQGATLARARALLRRRANAWPDRKSTRLNSSHGYISYAVFCLKKKNIHSHRRRRNSHRAPVIHCQMT